MLTINDIVQAQRAKNMRPSDEELRLLPYKNAFTILACHPLPKLRRATSQSRRSQNWSGWQKRMGIILK